MEPVFVPRIWGSRNLATLFPEKQSLSEPIGEVWLTGNDCRFADGPFGGKKLGDVWPRMSDDWAGKHARRDRPFPVLVKFLFPDDKLSVQVHPDDDYAAKHEGGTGKTEMWYAVSARPGAEVRVGVKSKITKESFRRAIADGIAEQLLERIPVNSGDAIFVPAGTAHTIGPGMVLCEIQQNSDVTYRVYDFGRVDAQGKTRELHIEKALDVIRFGKQEGGQIGPTGQKNDSGESWILAECPYFAVVKRIFARPQYLVKPGRQFEIMVALEGRGILRTPLEDAQFEYAPGQVWMIPAALRDCVYEPESRTTLLSVTVPEEA